MKSTATMPVLILCLVLAVVVPALAETAKDGLDLRTTRCIHFLAPVGIWLINPRPEILMMVLDPGLRAG